MPCFGIGNGTRSRNCLKLALSGRNFGPLEKPVFYTGTSNFDLAPDGNHCVIFEVPEPAPGAKGSVHVTMLLNFFDELKRRIP